MNTTLIKELNLSSRANLVLKHLNIKTVEQLLKAEIPSPGTVIKENKNEKISVPDVTMNRKAYDEINNTIEKLS